MLANRNCHQGFFEFHAGCVALSWTVLGSEIPQMTVIPLDDCDQHWDARVFGKQRELGDPCKCTALQITLQG